MDTLPDGYDDAPDDVADDTPPDPRLTVIVRGMVGHATCRKCAGTFGACGCETEDTDAKWRGPYKVKAGEIRALSPDARKRLRDWQRRVSAAESKANARPPTIAALNPAVMERTKRLSAWANANAGCWRRSAAKGCDVKGDGRSKVQVIAELEAQVSSLAVQLAAAKAERDEARAERNAWNLSADAHRAHVERLGAVVAWARETARDVDGLVSDPSYVPSESWPDRRRRLERHLSDA